MLNTLCDIIFNVNRHQSLKLILPAIVSIVAVQWIYMKILKMAKTRNMVDNPNARKLQENPVPVLGGIAMFFGMLTGILTACCLFNDVGIHTTLFVAMGIMLYVGVLDDTIGVSPSTRLLIETLAILGLIYGSGMCVDSLHGLWGINDFSWWIGVPVTVFAGLGIINAYNMVDGVNGLSTGLCILCVTMLGAFFIRNGYRSNATLSFCFAASLIPFLLHNVFGNKSRMFIGDAGTMVMGLLITWFVIKVMSKDGAATFFEHRSSGNLNIAAMLVAFASIPVTDTLRVMTARIMKGVSPFKPDQTHLHHAFIKVGVSHSITSLIEIIFNMLVVFILAISFWCGVSLEWQLYIVVLTSLLFVCGTYSFLTYQINHDTKLLKKIQKLAVHTHLGHTRGWLKFQKLLDKGA